jgi:hypothetical protein
MKSYLINGFDQELQIMLMDFSNNHFLNLISHYWIWEANDVSKIY